MTVQNERINPAEEIIFSRRSVRRYSDTPVPQDIVDRMVDSARAAPSPSNAQPVRIVLCESSSSRAIIRDAVESGKKRFLSATSAIDEMTKAARYIEYYHRYAAFACGAPLLFIVASTAAESFSSRLRSFGIITEDTRENTDSDISAGMAMQNMLLCAHSFGIGCCVLSAPLVFAGDLSDRVGLGEMRIVSLVSAGYPAESPHDPGRLPRSEIYRVI
jgi:nitroreductase